jgi:hypothetical protein
MYQRALNEGHKHARLHTASPHLPVPVRGDEDAEEPPELVFAAILTVLIVALALTALVIAL